jgi:hypothetical protein
MLLGCFCKTRFLIEQVPNLATPTGGSEKYLFKPVGASRATLSCRFSNN